MSEKIQRFCRVDLSQYYGLNSLIEKLPKDCVMAELGVFAGESSAMFAKKCKMVYCVDIWQGGAEGMSKVVGSSETAFDIERRFDSVLNKNKNMQKIKKRTDEAYLSFQDESLDFVYIDAQHEYAPVRADIVNWLPKIKKGGWIGGHDYDKKDWPGVVQAVSEIFGDKIEIFEDTSWLAKVEDEKISVLMPVYNREKYVVDAIKSLQKQTHTNIEIIVFDDSSTDNSYQIVEKLACEDTRIKLFKDPTNKGITWARNKLLQLCKTRLACWMDSDDLVSQYRIEILFPFARNGKTFVLSNGYWFKDVSEINEENYPIKKIENKYQCPAPCVSGFTCANTTPSSMFFVDKSVKFEHHMHNKYLGEDCYWLSRMIAKYRPIVLDDVLYYHREHDERMVKVVPELMSKSEGKTFHDLLFEHRRKKFKRAVVTIVNGDFYKFMATKTHPSIQEYAKKCNAEFVVMSLDDNTKTNDIYNLWSSSCWLKFKMKELLETFDELLYIDTDVIISENAEDLFEKVPEGHVGFFNELPFSDWPKTQFSKYLDNLGLDKKIYFTNTYYNAGIFVVRKEMKNKLFDFPKDKKAFENTWELCAEQSYLNINITKFKIPVYDIGARYNAFVRDEKNGKIFDVNCDQVYFFHLCGIFGINKQSEAELNAAINKVRSLCSKKATTGVIYPKVSVLIPVFNRQRYLAGCLQTILDQTYSNIEVLIYDDGSDDGSLQIAKNFASKDSRIRLIEGKENLGVGHARNVLLGAATGSYGCWMDSDDLANINRIKEQVEVIKVAKNDLIVKTNASAFNDVALPDPNEEPQFPNSKLNNFPSTMFPIYKDILFNEDLKFGGEDDDWEQRMQERCKILVLPQVLYYYRVHNDRISSMKTFIHNNQISTEDMSYKQIHSKYQSMN